ncbi:hypothetical protein GOP47_0012325 [Adiantum capillus-veneris]|uniref:Uncharacterized protein n=1 Tax=Adiantum capillus-veneris TaxID=13818 RepID=A0A9D4ZEC0_ADICA|nr:hypothetical protein GOP47_0012325 [Adiantum capillus-veneris]
MVSSPLFWSACGGPVIATHYLHPLATPGLLSLLPTATPHNHACSASAAIKIGEANQEGEGSLLPSQGEEEENGQQYPGKGCLLPSQGDEEESGCEVPGKGLLQPSLGDEGQEDPDDGDSLLPTSKFHDLMLLTKVATLCFQPCFML